MPVHKDCPRCQSYLPESDGCLRIAHGLKCAPPAEKPPVTPEEEEAFQSLANNLEMSKVGNDVLVFGSGIAMHLPDGTVKRIPPEDIKLGQ